MLNPLLQPSIDTTIRVTHKRENTTRPLTLKDIFKILRHLNLNTIRFNFTYLGFWKAIYFPVFVSKHARLSKLKGSFRIDAPLCPGMILLGFGNVGHIDRRVNKLIWEIEGNVVFKGAAIFKYGAKIIIARGAYLEIGNKFRMSSNSVLICYKKIVFGDNCRLSWDVQVMDTDFHKIKSLTGDHLNPPRDIIIGDHVWIGAKAMIMKGAKIMEDCVVASSSVVNKEIPGSHQIIAGMPAKVIKTGVTWDK